MLAPAGPVYPSPPWRSFVPQYHYQQYTVVPPSSPTNGTRACSGSGAVVPQAHMAFAECTMMSSPQIPSSQSQFGSAQNWYFDTGTGATSQVTHDVNNLLQPQACSNNDGIMVGNVFPDFFGQPEGYLEFSK